MARYCDAMSSALVQTLIGGSLAIIGGLLAAWWQTSRSDNVAQKIRRAERYESALIELNARVAETVGQVGKVFGDAMSASSRGPSHENTDASEYAQARDPLNKLLNHWHKVFGDARSASSRGLGHENTDASEYAQARDPLNELLNHWHSVSSLFISDTTIVEAFVRLHQESATHMWQEDNMAYSEQPPIDGKVDTTQFVQDLEAVYFAVSEASKEVRLRVAALHDAPRSLHRAITARVRRSR